MSNSSAGFKGALQERDDTIATLKRRIAELEKELHDLKLKNSDQKPPNLRIEQIGPGPTDFSQIM